LKNVNQLGITHKENIFQTNFKNSCSLIVDSTWLIKLLKHNIYALFPSHKFSWIQNDGDLVVSQQVKVKPSLGHHVKNVLSHIVPVPSRIRALTKSRSKSTTGKSKSTRGVAQM